MTRGLLDDPWPNRGILANAANQTARSNPWLGVPAIMGKPIVEAGLAGLGWGAGATKAAASGHTVDPAPSLYHALNIYGMGGPASGLTAGAKRAAPWFSALGRAADSSPLTTGTSDQWLGWLKNQPGIKQEELDWMGVPEWLSSQPGPVTKQQVTDYIGQNKVDVQEVVKGDSTALRMKELGRINPRERTQAQQDEFVRLSQEEHLDTDGSNVKFAGYQLPGGENYRELLLTMPEKVDSSGWTARRSGPQSRWEIRDAEGRPFFSMAPQHTEEEALRLAARNLGQEGGGNSFRSSHYDEPNVLAHVRFNDRIDANGKKTLFLEEIQSDWHQKGRKEGYKQKLSQVDAARAWSKDHNVRFEDLEPSQIESAAANYRIENSGKQTVPDAPFKKDWHELSLKRMIKWAADNGYDQVAWTPGKVQAARYDLSKQVSHIDYRKKGNGYELGVVGKDGEGISLPKDVYTAEELADVVGKEVAEKIVNGEGKSGGGRMTLSGVDLQVGGEGMAGFYDKILPNTANKLFNKKQYGFAKVGVTKLGNDKYALSGRPKDATEVWSLPITDAMRTKVQSEGMPLFSGGKGAMLSGLLGQALTGDNQSLGGILGRSLTKGR
jgi:hypothetical protein